MKKNNKVVAVLVVVSVLASCIAQIKASSIKQQFSTKHETLISQLRDYRLIRPYRSTSEGDFVTHDLSTEEDERRFEYHRARRHAENGRSRRHAADDGAEDPPNVLHFSMDAFGTRITINVTRDTHLVSPSFKVNRYMSDGSIITSRPKMNCFYRGTVVGAEGSAVAVSNCRGMSGLIQTQQDEYFIEPLETDVQSATYNFSQGHVHIMYRRRDFLTDPRQTERPDRVVNTNLRDDVMRMRDSHRHHVTDQRNRRRSRRQTPATSERRHYVETMITLDYGVRSFHGDEQVSHYVLTIMNIVNLVYSHPSLDAHVVFIITRANILNEEMSANLVVENNSMDSLSNTCMFARRQKTVVRDDGSDDYFDHSIFLTRTPFGPAGYAPVGYMCSISHSCSLTKDDGLQSAFVVAHETGHVLGMEHDGEGNVCYDDASGMSIMATVVLSTQTDHYWSECSKNELHSFLPSWTCLWDNPTAGLRPPSDTRPGRNYTMDQQCRYQFGDDYRKCHHTDVDFCRELYCTGPDLNGGCVKKGPPLDGSECGRGRWCIRERCVSSAPVDGGWGEWGPWGRCSHTCGLGVQVKRRPCNNPAPDGGRDCEGPSEEYRLCNTQMCPDGIVDKQEVQCRKLSQRTGETYRAYQNTDPDALCKLSCVSEVTGEIYVSQENVDNATPASYDNPELICINGHVVSVGCDVQLGSEKLWDNCGVCDGQNETCVHIADDSVDPKPKAKKYKKLMELTPGMWNLNVTKTAPSSHFLALKIEENGRYILNRAKQQSHSHAFIESGVRFVYTTDGEEETLTAKGPIPYTLLLMTYATTDRRPLSYRIEHYENTGEEGPVTETTASTGAALVPPTAGVVENPDYTWVDLGWTKCNRPCGGGYSFHRYQCTRNRDNRKVKYKLCGRTGYNPKGEKRGCNEHPCPTEAQVITYEWLATDWSECSVTCGVSGTQTRDVQCFQILNGVQQTVAEPSACTTERPTETQPCALEPCAASWRKGAWSQCSATCGPGVKTREVTCGPPGDYPEGEYQCSSLQPPSTKKCELLPCPETECRPMQSILCDPERFLQYCNMPGYSQVCCTTCEEQLRAQLNAPSP